MKRKLTFVLLFVLLFAMMPAAASASDYTGGLLDNEEMITGTVPAGSEWQSTFLFSNTGSSSFLTDNDTNTYFVASPVRTGATYTFSSPHDINGYIINAERVGSSDPLYVGLIFYDENDQAIYVGNPHGTYFYMQIGSKVNIDIENVKKIVVFSGSGSYNIREFNLFGIPVEAPLSAPELIATAGNAQVHLSWNAVDGAESYNVHRSLTEGGPYTVIGSVYGTTYTDTDVENGITYYYVVTAVNNDGESDPSNEASATPFAPEPEDNLRALLTLYLTGGQVKEYDVSADELDAFLDWFDDRAAGTGPERYGFDKTWNKGPFKTRTEYVIFSKIDTFDVDEYEVEE